MSIEHSSSSTNHGEEFTPLEKFERLQELMKGYVLGDSGYLVLPQTRVPVTEKSTKKVRFLLFLPKPIPEYTSRYSPSLIMEVGSRRPKKVTGELIGKVDQTYIRRAYFDESSAYYEKNYEQAVEKLEKIDALFNKYIFSVDPSKQSE